ncbi:hypothetical protein ACFE04_018340 [Oxalis oulophora]
MSSLLLTSTTAAAAAAAAAARRIRMSLLNNNNNNNNLKLNNNNNVSSFNYAIAAAASIFSFQSSDLGVTVCKSSSSSSSSSSNKLKEEEEDDDDDDDESLLVEDLKVPDHWLLPSNAFQESEWLRVTLHEWLDDEYCPEDTNVEISKVAANSYYNSLLQKQTHLSDILLNMAADLESISYRESFHGAFSSANAAISLILRKIEQPQL